jgi:hypothetical protein
LLHQQLGDAIAPGDVDGDGSVGIDPDHADLTPVPGIDGPRAIDQGEARAQRQTAPRMDQPYVSGRQRDSDTCGNLSAFSRLESDVHPRAEVPAGIARTTSLRQRQGGIESLDEYFGTSLGDHVGTVASPFTARARVMLHTQRVLDTAGSENRSTVLYRERVLPSFAWWIVVAALIAMVSIAYGAALGSRIGLIVGSGLVVLAALGLIRSSPVIEVSSHTIRCGRASIPRALVTHIARVDGPRIATIRRGHDPNLGDRTFQVLPAWFSRSALVLQVDDPGDPHSAWLIATRHPDRLEQILSTRVAG